MLIVAGAIYFSNQPKKFNPAESRIDPYFGRDDYSNYLRVAKINREREVKRREATKYAIWGVVVLFIGVGLRMAGKK